MQGFSCVLTGLIGSGNGTTAYNENIGTLTNAPLVMHAFSDADVCSSAQDAGPQHGWVSHAAAGALQLTRVGSRRVIQVGAVFAIVISVIGAPHAVHSRV